MDENVAAQTHRDERRLRRVLVIVGLTLLSLVLIALAIYAAAFLMLAPMMQ